MTDLEFLSRRVLKLEARLRWMTRAGVFGVLMAAAAAIMAKPAQTPQGLDQLDVLQQIHKQPPLAQQDAKIPEAEVRSEHFVLVDSKGKDRASLIADNAGTVFLILFDAAGKTRANLSVGNEGPSLVFYDNAGKPRTIIGSTTLVGSHVNENGIAELSPPSSIVLFDKAGKLLWREP
ncbi:MAG TPA: hypothetical protein VGK48_22765 [Terriglobia bacterium]|jgi:hypothetical protein